MHFVTTEAAETVVRRKVRNVSSTAVEPGLYGSRDHAMETILDQYLIVEEAQVGLVYGALFISVGLLCNFYCFFFDVFCFSSFVGVQGRQARLAAL